MVRIFAKWKSLSSIVCVCAMAGFFSFCGIFNHIDKADAAINKKINYQGKLTNASNQSVPDDRWNMRFKLYTSPTGGTEIWTETRTLDNRATTTSGLFSILLGSVDSLDSVDFNRTLYLSVEIGGTTTVPTWDGEMSPRKELGAVPAAFTADTIDGIDSSMLFRKDQAETISTSTATTLLTVQQNGNGNIVDFKDNTNTVFSILDGGDIVFGNNAVVFDYSSGNFGIGTSTPMTKLDVFGDLLISGPNRYLNFGNATGTGGYGIYDNSGVLQFKSAGGSWISMLQVGTGQEGWLPFYSSAGNSLTATSSLYLALNGNVGIGTTTPTSKLSVYGDLLISGNNRFLNFGQTAGTTGYGLYDNGGIMQFKNSGASWTNLAVVASGTPGWVPYYAGYGNALTATSSMYISSSGKIGLGTTTPRYNLDVSGTMYAANYLTTGGSLVNDFVVKNEVMNYSTDLLEGTYGLVNNDQWAIATSASYSFGVDSLDAEPLGNGNYIVVYGDYFYIFDNNGNVIKSNTVYDSTAAYPRVAQLKNDEIFIAYQKSGNIYFKKYDTQGNQLTSAKNIANSAQYADIAILPSNNIIVTYVSNTDAFFTIIDPNGDVVLPPQTVTTNSVIYLNMAVFTNGNFIISYSDATDSDRGKFAVYNSSGSLIKKATFNTGGTYYLHSTTLNNGNMLLSYHDLDTARKGTFVIVDSKGNIIKNETVYTSARADGNYAAALADGSFVITYTDTEGGVISYATFDSKGNAVGQAGNIGVSTYYYTPVHLLSSGQIVILYNAGFTILNGQGGFNRNIYVSNGGMIAIGTTSPSHYLTVGATISQQFLVNSIGQVVGGTWMGSVIGAAYGGTGTSTYSTGDLLYASAANTLNRRAIGNAGDVLMVSGGVPVWTPTSSLGFGSGTVNSGTQGQLAFYNADGTAVSGTSTLFIASSGFLGIGTATPAHLLDIYGSRVGYLMDIYNAATSALANGLSIRVDGDGNLLRLNHNGTDVMTVTGAQTTFYNPVVFESAGDISIENNLVLSNGTAGNLLFSGPGYIRTDSGWENLDLTLSAANLGDVIVDDSFVVIGTSTLADLLYVNSFTGKVGIGSSSPQYTLAVNGSLYADDIYTSSSTFWMDGKRVLSIGEGLKLYNGSYSSGFKASTSLATNLTWSLPTATGTVGQVLASDGNGSLYWKTPGGEDGTVNSGTQGQLAFYNADGTAVSGTSSLFVAPNGSIGIGTTSPSVKLSIEGSLLLSGQSNYLNFGSVASSSGYGFRDNSGILEFKRDANGAWLTLAPEDLRGYKQGLIVTKKDDDEFYVSGGSIEINGRIFRVTSQLIPTSQPETPTTWNPSDQFFGTLSAGNLIYTSSASSVSGVRSVASVASGKWYWEIKFTGSTGNALSYTSVGVATSTAPLNYRVGYNTAGWGYLMLNGDKYNANTAVSYGSQYSSNNDIVGVALDMDNGKLWFSYNGSWQASGDPANDINPAFTGISGSVYPMITIGVNSGLVSAITNFGATAFSYTPPSGYNSGLLSSTYAVNSIYYVYVKPVSGSSLSASDFSINQMAPVFDQGKGGYYHPVQNSWRAIASFMTDASGSISSTINPIESGANLNMAYLRPINDSMSAIQLQNAGGASILSVDTLNLRIGINTTTPSQMLTVGATTSQQFLVNTTGQVVGGTWMGSAIGAAFGGTGWNSTGSSGVAVLDSGVWSASTSLAINRGGTGATDAAGARTNLGLDTIYTYGITSAGTAGQVWMSDGSGAGTWASTSTLIWDGDFTANGLMVRTGAGAYTSTTTLTNIYGGTGFSAYTKGDMLFATSTNNLAKLAIGAAGDLLTVSADGRPSWVTPSAFLADGDFTANGLMVRTADGTYANRTAAGTANEITVINGDGVSGDPTISLPDVVYLGAAGKIGRDADNLFDLSTDNQIGFRVNGADRMVLDSNGRLGIGTTTPNNALSVFSTSGGQLRLGYDADTYVDFTVNSAGELSIAGSGSATTTIGTGDDALVVDSLGRIGIGTSSPWAKLSVVGSSAADPILNIASSSGSSLLFIGPNGRMGVGTANPGTLLHVGSSQQSKAELKVQADYNGPDDAILTLSRTKGGSYLNDWDWIGHIQFSGMNNNNEWNDFFKLAGGATDVSDGSEGGFLEFWGMHAGSEYRHMHMSGTDTIFNFDKLNMDFAVRSDDDSYALFMEGSNGFIGIGTSNPGSKLHLVKTDATNSEQVFKISTSTSGSIFSVLGNGDFRYDGAGSTPSADYAEYFATRDTDLVSGEVVCVDIERENSVKRCERTADGNVMGIVSSQPAIIGNAQAGYANNPRYKVIGMLGQVPARVSTENGPIRPGDSLTSASIPGYAMRANPGDSTVGVALEGFVSSESGVESGNSNSQLATRNSPEKGIINVLISRRNKSLTVEQVESKITEQIAAMEIEDEVQLMVSDAVAKLNLDTEISEVVDPKMLLLDSKLTVAMDDFRDRLENNEKETGSRLSVISNQLSGVSGGLLEVRGDVENLKASYSALSANIDNYSALNGKYDNLASEMSLLSAKFNEIASATDANTRFLEQLRSSIAFDAEGNMILGSSSIKGDSSSAAPNNPLPITDNESSSVAIVDISASSTYQTALIVKQSSSGDIADFSSSEVSVMNIASNGKVSIVGEMMIDGSLKICSGGACDAALNESVDETLGDMGVEGKVVAGAFESYCGEGFVWVPGSAKYGTMPGFCVMASEARKDENYKLQITNYELMQDTNQIYTGISQGEAKMACRSLGTGYHLISENEWLTIAENVLNIADNDMDKELAGIQLTTGTTTNFILTSGAMIYDIVGGVSEWTDKVVRANDVAKPETGDWMEYSSVESFGNLGDIEPPYYLSSANGTGRIRTGISADPVRGFVRGNGGLYSLDLSNSPTTATGTIGFRCAR